MSTLDSINRGANLAVVGIVSLTIVVVLISLAFYLLSPTQPQPSLNPENISYKVSISNGVFLVSSTRYFIVDKAGNKYEIGWKLYKVLEVPER